MSIDPDLASALQLHKAGKLAAAETLYRRLLAREPRNANALNLLGALLAQAGQWDNAIDLIRKAIAIDPQSGDFQNNLGNALRNKGLFAEAIAAYRAAIRLKTNFAQAHYNLGNALVDQGSRAQAIESFREAIRLKPDLAEAHNNLANALRHQGLLDPAIESYQQTLRLRPKSVDAHCNLAIALTDHGRLPEAIQSFRQALALDPESPEAHFNFACTLLLNGDFSEGFREFEWRWRCAEFRSPRRGFTQPLWDGSDLNGRTILLHREQGLGDTLQMARYIKQLAERGGKVIFECQPGLIRLMRQLPAIDQLIAVNDPLPHFDLHCPMLSLPLAFATRLETIPAEISYLKADPALSAEWAERLAGAAGRKVGIVWAGNPHHLKDRIRSIPLRILEPLADIPNIAFFTLQTGDPAREVINAPEQLNVIDHTAHLNDFADTAAFVANLDLIISVDTAVAHLAGAMGKQVWLLLPYSPDWRWMLHRQDSPWYSTMRLFRQSHPGDWPELVNRVKTAFRE